MLHIAIMKRVVDIMARQSKEMKALKERMRYWRKSGYAESTYYQTVVENLKSGKQFDITKALRVSHIGRKNLLLNVLLERNMEYIYQERGYLYYELKTERIFDEENIDDYISKLQEYEKNNAQIVQNYEQSPNFNVSRET